MSPRLTAAIPMVNPYCSCELTRVRSLLQRAILRSLCECIGSGVLESLSGIELTSAETEF